MQLFCSKNKNLLVFENKFHHAFSYENCTGCAIRKSHLAVLVVLVGILKSQLAVHKKALKKLGIKKLMKLTPGFLFSSWPYFLVSSVAMGERLRVETQWWERCQDTEHIDIQHNDTQHNNTQHNNTQHNNTQHNNTQRNNISIITLSTSWLGITLFRGTIFSITKNRWHSV